MAWATTRYSDAPGSRGLVLTVIGFIVWNAVVGIFVLAPGELTFSALWSVRLFAANLAAIGWALMVVGYVRRGTQEIGAREWLALFAIPVVTQLLYLTNATHHLVVRSGSTLLADGALLVEHGPWFFVHASYNYVVLAFGGLLVLLWDYARSSGLHRRQMLVLFAGAAIAVPASTGALIDLPLPGYVDPAPFGFLITASLWTYAIFKHDLFCLIPVARETAVETIPDALVAVDPTGTIVDANDAARDLFDVSAGVLGANVATLEDEFATVLQHDLTDGELERTVTVVRDDKHRHFSVTLSPVSFGDSAVATIAVFRDVTDLRKRNQEVELLQTLFSRVLRHNLRTTLQLVRGHAEIITEADTDTEAVRSAGEIIDAVDDLERTSHKVRRVESVIGSEFDLTVQAIGEMVDDLIEQVSSGEPVPPIDRQGQETAWVRAHPALESAIRGVLENAVHYADPTDPAVSVELAVTEADVRILIADNGPGIPQAELDALDKRTESPLEHGSGAGLWLTDWVIEKSGGTLSFDVSETGTTVTVRLARVTSESDDHP